ncbi:unnamed protein product [Mesocestoides corti]|nr:unnamed protein product [Mesocestoides corti]
MPPSRPTPPLTHGQMMSSQENKAVFLPTRSPLVNLNHFSHRDPSKRPFNDEVPSSNSKRNGGPATLFAYSVTEFNECGRCEKARLAGLDSWMDHLGKVHTVPSRWPSSKIDDVVMDEGHPYTSVVDSHKKRRSTGVPRPLNSFMIFAQYIRRMTLSNFPDAPNVHISQQVGRLWRNLSNDFREVYAKEARRLQILHALEFPDYKYQPRRRLRPLDGEDVDPQPSPLHSATSKLPSNINVSRYFEELLHYSDPGIQPKPSHPIGFDTTTRLELHNSLPDLSLLGRETNMDTLTSLQEVSRQQQPEEPATCQSTFHYSAHIDGNYNRLGWMEDRLPESLGSPSTHLQPFVTSFSQSNDLLPSNEHWYQYPKENSLGEALPLPGIETWTFSGSAT